MKSALYFGQVRHRRTKPVLHGFRYNLFMVYMDLAELDTVFEGNPFWSIGRPNIAWLCRTDHFGDPRIFLDQAVRELVAEKTGRNPTGPVRMLTHLRYFGHCFNPVTFYYCFSPDDTVVDTIIAEIHNTPWGEVHCYVLDRTNNLGNQAHQRFHFAKAFHISPFMPMDITYDWEFDRPGEALYVHMMDKVNGEPVFEAVLNLTRQKITNRELTLTLLRYPLMTVKVISAIYWQALQLRLKGAVYYPHPE
ncbi:MAG: DUF1365 domain-containing protein [Desulfobacterales bacterium]|jgi:DUF1365 family protein|nr:DUF1365 domain-containing protein [Desulfobacterales bacterium]